MHKTQEKILRLAEKKDIGKLKLRELGTEIGETHPQKVKHHLQHLIKKGLLKLDSYNKSITVTRPGVVSGGDFIAIPVVGYANCGIASMVAEERFDGMLMVSRSFVKTGNSKSLFAVKAVGNSLNQANMDGKTIDDGDYVIVDKSKIAPESNRYVLSVIDGLANIKKLVIDVKNRQYVLLSESSQNIPPIYIGQDDFQDYMINGTVVGVMKKPSSEA